MGRPRGTASFSNESESKKPATRVDGLGHAIATRDRGKNDGVSARSTVGRPGTPHGGAMGATTLAVTAEWRASNLQHRHATALDGNPHRAIFQTHRYRREQMGEIIDKTKGKIKQATGILAGDKKLENQGRTDEAKGKVKGAVEDIKRTVKGAMKK
jgi:uncharacterized protein YjbJ (UPF0337 family)